MNARLNRRSPFVIMGLGASAYLLMAVLTDALVVGTPDGNRVLHTIILTLLGLAFVTAADGFLALIRAISPADVLGAPFCSAAVGSVAYSLVYDNRVFINYWYYDDWSYFAWVERHPFDKAFLVEPLNDHFVPLLKILLWCVYRVFGFNYIGAACLQQTACLMIVLVLGHLLWSATHRAWVVTLLVGLFAMWPTYGLARTWFAGGFWLTASAALLSIYVLHTRRIVFSEALRVTDLAVSFALAVATVCISSQTMAPAVYLAAFYVPILLLARDRSVPARKLGLVCAISLLPTAFALWGRSAFAAYPPMNVSGLFDGRLLANLGIFILNKALFTSSYEWFTKWRPMFVLSLVFLLPLLIAAIRLAVPGYIEPSRRARLASIIVGGSAIFVLSLAQIGLGRRWSYDAVLNPYYITLPFLGLWLALAGIGLSLSSVKEAGSARPTWKALLAAAAVVGGAVFIAAAGVGNDAPLAKRLKIIHTQRQFVDDLGAAVCDLARLHGNGPFVLWRPHLSVRTCEVCQDVIGPEPYLHTITVDKPERFDSIAHLAAQRRCPAVDLQKVFSVGPAAQTASLTDGSESAAARSFILKYLHEPGRSLDLGR